MENFSAQERPYSQQKRSRERKREIRKFFSSISDIHTHKQTSDQRVLDHFGPSNAQADDHCDYHDGYSTDCSESLSLSLSLVLQSSSNLSDHLYTDQTFQLTEIEKERVRDRNGSTRIFIFSSLQDQKITKIPTDGMCQRCSTLAASGDAPSKTERIGNEKCDTRS